MDEQSLASQPEAPPPPDLRASPQTPHSMLAQPHKHRKWQKSLVLALETVRQREGSANKEYKNYDWHNLPELHILLTEHWELKPIEGDETVPISLTCWKNSNSFVSRLAGSGFVQVNHLGIWEIREALEKFATKGPLMDCRVWVAAEWILCSSQALVEEMKAPTEELTQDDAESLKTGHLYGDNLPPRSMQRWEFWKKRLVEIAKEPADFSLEDETKKRVEEALKAMEPHPQPLEHVKLT